MTMDKKKIDQIDIFTHLGSIISKDGWCSGNVKSRIAEAKGKGVLFTGRKSLEKCKDKSTNQEYTIGNSTDDSG